MKVSELDGALLDYWVARASNLPQPRVDDGICWVDVPACDGDPAGALDAAFSPSTDWEVGGQIIERERISIKQSSDGSCYAYFGHKDGSAVGSMPLIAAMRAYVTSKFGEEVASALQSEG